jgi:hypothetical protein
MTDNTENVQPQTNQVSDKELNFRKLEAKYQQELGAERARREDMEKRLNEMSQHQNQVQEVEEDDPEPYVDHKRLEKKLAKFGQSNQSQIEKAMQQAKVQAKEELKQEMFLDNNPDFYHVLELADKFAERSPKLAENILRMPAGFDRQKLVYQTIKELGLHKDPVKETSIQEKVDAARRSPYYQPTSVGAAPYQSVGNYSPDGQKQAYDKMKELQSRLRL